jgi:hypothetical protein
MLTAGGAEIVLSEIQKLIADFSCNPIDQYRPGRKGTENYRSEMAA